MKKIVSFLLLLAMVLGCFAGCAPEAPAEDAGLNAAAEYLYAMYKDSDAKTAVDYSVVGQVRIEDVVYPITWTVDKTDNVQITTGENNMVFVKLIPGTEDINYKLTATLKNANGQEASVSFDHFIPKADGAAVTLADGTYVILAGNLTMSSLSADKSYGYPYATEVTVADGAVSGYTAADVLTIKNVDGGFTIQDAQGRYFYLKGTYNSFNVDATAPAEGHIFSILSKDGKYLIQNNLEKKTLAYSTSYSSWGCYPELTDDHTSLVDIIAVTASDATPAPDSGNNNSGNTGNNNTGSTGGDKVDTDKTSATIYYAGEKLYITGTEYAYTSSTSGKTKIELTLSDKKADAIALTIKTNSDKTISFVAGGKYLFCDGTDVKFVSSQSDNTKFVLESAGKDQYYIKCAVANYNGNPQYLEVYKGYLTCYGMGADASIYTFELKDTSGAKGKVTHVGSSSSGGNTSGGNTSGGNTSGGNTSGGNTSGGNTSGGNTSGGNTSGGNTGSTSDYTQVSSLKNGDKVVIVNPASNMALSMNKVATYYNEGISVAGGFNNITKAEIFTVTKNSDGTYSFTSLSGKKLALADEFSSLNDTGANAKWELSSAGSKQFYLKNVARGNYLEWYASKNNWSTYAPESLTDEFVLTFYVTSGNGSSSSSGSSSGGNTSGGNTGSGSTGTGNTSSGTSSKPVGTSVTFDFSSLDKKGVEITDGGWALFDGAASAGGLTEVELTKVFNGNGTGGAFESTPGLLKLGTSSTNGKMVLTFSKKVAKVEILCHGWKSGTDNISINGSTKQLPNNGTASTLTFNLESPSQEVTIDVNQRAFIFKIIVTFVD